MRKCPNCGLDLDTIKLTPREAEVEALLVQCKVVKEIATELGLSTHTVEVHKRSVYQKRGVHSIAQLIRAVMKEGGGKDVHSTPTEPEH